MSRGKLLLIGVAALLLVILSTGGAAAADVEVDSSPTDWEPQNKATHTVVFSVESGDSSVGQTFNDIKIDYSAGSYPADVSNVGTGTIKWVGIDEGGDDEGTRYDEAAKVNSVTGKADGKAVLIKTNQELTINSGDEVVVVLHPVQQPSPPSDKSKSKTSAVNVTLNTQSGSDVAQDEVKYVNNDASVRFNNQNTSGESINVDYVDPSEGGYVVILNDSGQNPGLVRGYKYLPAKEGGYDDVEVDITPGAVDGEDVSAQVHLDTNGNKKFDWSSDDTEIDRRYKNEDGNTLAVDSATLTLSPPNFELSGLSPATQTVSEGTALDDITVDAENTGGKSGTQSIGLTVRNTTGSQLSSTETGVSLGSGSSETARSAVST